MGNFIALTVPDERDMGPAMRACTVAEREFVVALFQNGADNYTQAARATGRYSSNESAQAVASRWMAKPRVIAALDEYTRIVMKQGLAVSTRALLEIANDPMHKDRFRAASELLNRNGHIIETVSRHVVEHDHSSTKELLQEITSMAREVGVDPQKLLGNAKSDAIEGEFSEVDDLKDLMA